MIRRWSVLLGIILCSVLIVGCQSEVATEVVVEETVEEELSTEELYELAMEDSMIAEEDEIQELVALTEDDNLVTWDEEGRVLLLSYHSYPDSYPAGEDVVLEWGSVWAFTDKELEAVYEVEKDSVEDWTLRLEQLIGLQEDSGYTVITGMWVEVEDVTRPAYQSDATDDTMTNAFSEEVDEEYKEWFDENILDSYFYGAYPWTRLGYTYDWADNGTEYGVTEFLIAKGSEIEVAYTYTVEELWEMFEAN